MRNWSGHKIEYELKKTGYRQIDVVKKTGRSASWVHQVIHEGKVSDPVRRCIAEFIGVDVKVIWPEYYLRDSLVALPNIH